MSQIPSNTEQMLSGLAAGNQALGIASQNQQFKAKMANDAGMQQRELASQTENYARMNASKERMAGQDRAQQAEQFSSQQDFIKEAARAENLMKLRMEQIANNKHKALLESARMAPNDPRALEMKKQLEGIRREEHAATEQAAALSGVLALSELKKTGTMDSVMAMAAARNQARTTRLDGFKESWLTSFQGSKMENVRESGGWFNELARMTMDPNSLTGEFIGPPGSMMNGTAAGLPIMAAGLENLWNGTLEFFGATVPQKQVAASMTDFQKSGAVMAVTVIEKLMSEQADLIGLTPAEATGAAASFKKLVGLAAIAATQGGAVEKSGDKSMEPEMRAQIADEIAALRKLGVDDLIISEVLNGLQDLGRGRNELLGQAKDSDDPGQEGVLDNTLKEVGRIGDYLEFVATDGTLMDKRGGALSDEHKYDSVKVLEKANQAFGMIEGPELMSLVEELERQGLTPDEINKVIADMSNEGRGTIEGIRGQMGQASRSAGELKLRGTEMIEEGARLPNALGIGHQLKAAEAADQGISDLIAREEVN